MNDINYQKRYIELKKNIEKNNLRILKILKEPKLSNEEKLNKIYEIISKI